MIRRPILFAASGYTAAVIIAFYTSTLASVAAAAVMISYMLLQGRNRWTGRQKRIALIVMISFCAGIISFLNTDRLLTEQADALTGNSLQGKIIDCKSRVSSSGESFIRLTVQAERGKVIANCYQSFPVVDSAPAGCPVRLTGELKTPEGKRNPGCFDYSLYLKSIGVTKTVTCKEIEVDRVRPFREAPFSFIRNRVCTAREQFIEDLTERTDRRTGAMIRAVMFGDKGGLDEDIIEVFQQNGTAHILAVSGLHIGIIYAFILKLWRGRKRWMFFSFNTAFFTLYAAAADFSPSVTRAVVMILLHVLAGIRGWRYDLNNAAFTVGLAVIVRNPFMLFNAGFQMSFLAVLTLVLVLPYIKRFYSGVLLASLTVQIGLGPYILYSFNYLSLLAVFINVPVVALASLLVPSGLVAMGVSPLGDPFCEIAGILVRILCRMMQKLNETGQIEGVTWLQMPSPPSGVIAAYYLALLFFATEEGRLGLIRAADKGRYVLKILLIIVILSAGFHVISSDGYERCDLVFVDVGQGDCMHLKADDSSGFFRKNDKYNILIDGGGRDGTDIGKKLLRPYLLKNGVSYVDLAIVTHLHNDHYDGIRSLCRQGMVKKLCIYEGYNIDEDKIIEECGLKRKNLIYADAGDVITLGDASFTILAPPALNHAEYVRLAEDEEDENKKSLLIRADYHGVSAMMTGDVGTDGEKEAIDRQGAGSMRCDILKVGHHGSKTSTCDEFLTAVRPAAAVIQVGEHNMYGHPAPETLEKLESRGVPVFRNDMQGAIGIEIGRNKMKKVRTMVK